MTKWIEDWRLSIQTDGCMCTISWCAYDTWRSESLCATPCTIVLQVDRRGRRKNKLAELAIQIIIVLLQMPGAVGSLVLSGYLHVRMWDVVRA